MKLKSIITKTIAVSAVALVATACGRKDNPHDEAFLFPLISSQIAGLAEGNCAISINHTGLSYGALVQVSVAGAIDAGQANAFRDHYNAITGRSVTNLLTEPFNLKYDAFFTDRDSWNTARRAQYLTFAEQQAEANNLAAAGLDAVTYGGLKGARGTGLLACARIPRQNCSVSGLTTNNRAADINGAIAAFNAVVTNPACPLRNDTEFNRFTDAAFRGFMGETITTVKGNITFGQSISATTSIDTTTRILPEQAYPKFGNLVSLGFANLMPINKTQTAYNLTSDAFNQGKNLDAKLVASCETLGMGRGISVQLPDANQRNLTSTNEVAYALSSGGTAAGLYAGITGPETASKVDCNNSFRSRFAIPTALGGGRLPTLSGAQSGDGGTTQLLSICVYGGNTTSRTTAQNVLNGGLNLGGAANVPVCGQGNLEPFKDNLRQAASVFPDSGLENLSDFPNN